MKILLLSHVANNPHGGASRIYHMLSEALKDRGHEVELYHAEDAGISGGGLANLLKVRLILPRLISSVCLLYTSPSPRDATLSRMPSSA